MLGVMELPATPLVIVAGKGGVGRSATALALAQAYARRGERVAYVHPADADAARDHRPATGAAPAVFALDSERALHTYLTAQLPAPFASALSGSKVFGLLTAATPGLTELLTIGELRRLLEEQFERVVFDGPATGHLLALFDAPRRFERAAAVGPIAARARDYGDWIVDPSVVSYVAVTTGDGLAVSEVVDLVRTLETRTGLLPSAVIANRLAPPSPSGAELEAVGQHLADHPALPHLGALATRGRSERAQLGRITKAFGLPPLRVVERPGEASAAIAEAFEAGA